MIRPVDINDFDHHYDKTKREIGKANIVVAGKSGVGKSTLINAIFQSELSRTGTGKRVTENIIECSKDNIPVKIYDTVGLEIDKFQDFYKQIVSLIDEKIKTRDQKQYIHCIWYCVNATSNRFEEAEENFLRRIAINENFKHIPIFLILTQSYFKSNVEKFKKTIDSRDLPIKNIVSVVALNMDGEGYSIAAYGCDELIEKTIYELDNFAKNAFAAATKLLKIKRKQARAIIMGASVSSSISALAIPIPIADLAVISASQMGMLTSITHIFGLDVDRKIIKTLIVTILGGGGGSIVTLSFIKMLPSIGTAIGSTAIAVVAPAMTYALGEAYLELLTQIWDGTLEKDMLENKMEFYKAKEIMMDLFSENYEKAKKADWNKMKKYIE